MLKSVNYSVSVERFRDRYTEEYALLHRFHGGRDSNMALEYSSVADARRAYAALKKHIDQNRQPLGLHKRGNVVYVTRKEPEEAWL